VKRPPLPEPIGVARVYVGRSPVRDHRRNHRRDRRGNLIWKDNYRRLRLVGANTPYGPIVWKLCQIQALWKALPWHGTIEWSFDPETQQLVVRWQSPERRGCLRLNKARIAN
jgi:hypothetical protein